VVVARLGLMLEAVAGFATLVWAPTGIALAALLRYGNGVWPGIAIGAFVANVLTGAPVPVALGIGTGNTLEALAAAYVLGAVGFHRSLDRVRDALALVLFAAIGSTVLSATIGVASLLLGGLLPAGNVGETWRAWWVGDLIGDLVVAPLLLVWSAPRGQADPKRRPLEFLAVAVAVVATSLFIYEGPLRVDNGPSIFRHAYIFYPFLMWAALRFGQREVATTMFLVVAVAVAGTTMGRGPFALGSLHQSLFALQTFMAVSAATFVVLGASISERRQAASDLRKTQRDLECAVQARDALISVASHELKTPLTALQLQVHLIERTLSKSLEERPTEALGQKLALVNRQVARLARLIDNLLDVSRITAGRLQLELENVDLAAIAREAVSRFDEETRSAMSLRAESAVVGQWDPGRLDQVVTNLLSNAVKYGGGKPIEITVESIGDAGRIVVRDHGIGIAAQDQARIFERFERLAGTKTGGFGLGLWIVREIVRALSGSIEVESAPGAGATFVVELPKTNGAPATLSLTDPKLPGPSRSRPPDPH
jgi:signal transduction histidine kinase